MTTVSTPRHRDLPATMFVRLRTVTVLIALGLPFSACHRSRKVAAPPLPWLDSIDVRDMSPDRSETEGLNSAAIVVLTRKLMSASGLIAADDRISDGGPPTGARVRVLVTVGVEFAEVDTKGIVRAAVGVRMDTRPSDAPGAIEEELSAGGEQAYGVTPQIERRRLAQQLVERTLTDLLTGFMARARLKTAAPADIHKAIVGDGGAPALREEAIRIAGVRGLRDEVPALLTLLENDNEALRDAALGALIVLQERRAVAELTRNRSLRDRHEMRKILEAISILGGDEARDYLSFVAESHDDDEIRKLASDARARLERRQGQ